MNPWSGIPEFLAVVDTGSFSAAAQRLQVSTSYVSRQVAQLETRLGIRLLARSTRTVRLTDIGADYYRRCLELTHGLEDANRIAMGDTAAMVGQIRISAAGTLTERIIAPVLADFAHRHPQLNIEIDFNTRPVNLIEEGFDFAIRYGVLEDSGLIAEKLTNRTLIACASPAYLEQRGWPVEPEELKDHACLRSSADRWRFKDGDQHRLIRVTGPWRSNNGAALVAAAVRGLGIIYIPQVNFTDELATGQLIPILERYCDTDLATWLVYPERRHLPLRVRQTMDYLLAHFQAHFERPV